MTGTPSLIDHLDSRARTGADTGAVNMITELVRPPDPGETTRLQARRDAIAAVAPGLTARLAPFIDQPWVGLDQDRLWVVSPFERDPHRRPGGGYVVPARPLAELRRIASTGVGFSHLAVAHEVDRSGPGGQLIPVLRQGPRRCSDEIARRLVGPVPEHPGTARIARGIDLVAGVVVSSARASLRGAVGLGAAVVRDPIVFGIVGATDTPAVGETVLWFPLTAWEW